MEMTQQYQAGELSSILGELQEVASGQVAGPEVARLRHEAETMPTGALATVLRRALRLTDDVCWGALATGDTARFAREAAICTELWQFGLCADLLDESS